VPARIAMELLAILVAHAAAADGWPGVVGAPPQARETRAKGGAGSAGRITSLTCDAELGHRAGWGHLPRCRMRVRKGQRHQPASHLVRAVQLLALVPEVFTYSAALGVCDKRQQALHLLRALQHHAIEPPCRMWQPTAPPSACAKRGSSTGRPYSSHERCSAMPSCRM